MPTQGISRIKPAALQPGDTIAIVAPASNIKRELLETGLLQLEKLGYTTVYLDSILEQDLYFAGSVDRRVRELEEMFARPDVRAVVCARGGYGTNYLLGKLDIGKMARHPKIFVGYSDITTLLTAFTDIGGFVTFHGPMAARDFAESGGVDLESWQNALTAVDTWELNVGANSGVQPLVEGKAEGILYGGCLSMLVASLGTPYEIRTQGTILFVEDVATKPFQVDRMLMHLKLASKLDGVRGIVFGEMLDCQQAAGQGYTLQEVILRVTRELGIPVAYGLRSGHVSRGNITLPLGVRVALTVEATKVTMKFLEAATAPVAIPARNP